VVHSSAEGALKEKTAVPCGLTPDITCLIVPSLPAAVHRLKDDSKAISVLRVKERPVIQPDDRCPASSFSHASSLLGISV